VTFEDDLRFDLDELRAAAEHDGESATTVFIGGPGWDVIRAFIDVVDAARAVSYTFMPPLPKRPPTEWYRAMDRLLETTERFTNFGDIPKEGVSRD
jgi:hypothetical protein